MKKSEVKRIVEENIETLKKMLGLDRWDINFEYKPLSGRNKSCNGQCLTDVAWVDRALITLVPRKLYDKQDVLDVLQHELVHCIMSSHNIYMTAMAKLVSRKEYQALLVLHYRADEEATVRICKVLDGLKSPQPVSSCSLCDKEQNLNTHLFRLALCRDCFKKLFPEIEAEIVRVAKEKTHKFAESIVKTPADTAAALIPAEEEEK